MRVIDKTYGMDIIAVKGKITKNKKIAMEGYTYYLVSWLESTGL